MTKIRFQETGKFIRRAPGDDLNEFTYNYKATTSSGTEEKNISMAISGHLLSVWGYPYSTNNSRRELAIIQKEQPYLNLEKVLREIAKDYIIRCLLEKGSIQNDVKVILVFGDYPNGCPYNPDELAETNGLEYTV